MSYRNKYRNRSDSVLKLLERKKMTGERFEIHLDLRPAISNWLKFYEEYSTLEPNHLLLPETPRIFTDIRLVNQKILERIKRDPYEMYSLSSRQFEIMCAELYEERGYKVILTQETRDGGKDLIILNDNDLGKFMVYGECKRYAPDNPVSVNIVKQLAGNIWADKVTAGVVMTSSYFSPDAKDFANKFEHQLSLMDFNRLHQMMKSKP